MGNVKGTSLSGMLKFCTRALPLGHAFSRRQYASLNKVQKSQHFWTIIMAVLTFKN